MAQETAALSPLPPGAATAEVEAALAAQAAEAGAGEDTEAGLAAQLQAADWQLQVAEAVAAAEAAEAVMARAPVAGV